MYVCVCARARGSQKDSERESELKTPRIVEADLIDASVPSLICN